MSQDIPIVFLIGPRGSGKTSIGRMLAHKLGCELHDTDAMVVAEAGLSVADIVANEGWEGFRVRESRALAAAARPGCVVSTGGGMVLAEANREFMKNAGLVIYLSAPAEALQERIASGRKEQRPSLTDLGPLEEMKAVLAERGPLYRHAAHHSVDASMPLGQVLWAIMRILSRHKGKEE